MMGTTLRRPKRGLTLPQGQAAMKRFLFLLSLLILAWYPAVAAAQADEDAAVLALDDARVGQLRYLNLLLDRVDAEPLPFVEHCLDRSVEDAEACLRAGSDSGAPGLVFILDDAGDPDRDRPGLARLVCVGAGAAASDPARQSIMIWPRAYGLHGVTPFIKDREGLRACIAAAQAEVAR